jgi:hypothetical protein
MKVIMSVSPSKSIMVMMKLSHQSSCPETVSHSSCGDVCFCMINQRVPVQL